MILHNTIYHNVHRQIGFAQHSFMKTPSTTTNLFCFSQYLTEALDVGVQVDSIYTDFSKAFDRLDHEILINKLGILGFSDNLLSLLKSYLSLHTQ